MKRRVRVYLSGPISNGGGAPQAVRQQNVSEGIEEGLRLLRTGKYAPLIPHLSHFVAERASYDQWMGLDLSWVPVAEVLYRLPGESKGADDEVIAAVAAGIPVARSFEELEAIADSLLSEEAQPAIADNALPSGLTPEQARQQAEGLMEEAARLVRGDRNRQYGAPWDSLERESLMFTAILREELAPGKRVSPYKVGLLMQGMKLARAAAGYKPDTSVDTHGYQLVIDSTVAALGERAF